MTQPELRAVNQVRVLVRKYVHAFEVATRRAAREPGVDPLQALSDVYARIEQEFVAAEPALRDVGGWRRGVPFARVHSWGVPLEATARRAGIESDEVFTVILTGRTDRDALRLAARMASAEAELVAEVRDEADEVRAAAAAVQREYFRRHPHLLDGRGAAAGLPPPPSLRFAEAAARLGVRDYTVTRLVDAGVLRTVGGQRGKGQQITVESIEAYETTRPAPRPAAPKRAGGTRVAYFCGGCGEVVGTPAGSSPSCRKCGPGASFERV